MKRYREHNIKKITEDDYIKANRRGSREAELENQSGWNATHKVHKSKKDYCRNEKHKGKYRDNLFKI